MVSPGSRGFRILHPMGSSSGRIQESSDRVFGLTSSIWNSFPPTIGISQGSSASKIHMFFSSYTTTRYVTIHRYFTRITRTHTMVWGKFTWRSIRHRNTSTSPCTVSLKLTGHNLHAGSVRDSGGRVLVRVDTDPALSLCPRKDLRGLFA